MPQYLIRSVLQLLWYLNLSGTLCPLYSILQVPNPAWNLIPLVPYLPCTLSCLELYGLETLWSQNFIFLLDFILFFIFFKKIYKILTVVHVTSPTEFLAKIGLFGQERSVTSKNPEEILQNRGFYQKTSSTYFFYYRLK